MDSKRTRVKAGFTQVEGAADGRMNMARLRGATLIGAAVPGSQGTVRVWAPDRWRLWLAALRGTPLYLFLIILVFAALPAYALMLTAEAGSTVFLLTAALPLVALLAITLPGLLWPCYITTDDAGFGVTIWSRTRSLSWHDIQFMERGLCEVYEITAFPRRHEEAPNRISINLSGYSRRARQNILALFTENADLHPHLHSTDLLVCSESKLASQSRLRRRGAI